MALDLGKISNDITSTALEILKQSTVKTAAKIPEVQAEVGKYAATQAKDIIVIAAPIAVGVLVLILLLRK